LSNDPLDNTAQVDQDMFALRLAHAATSADGGQSVDSRIDAHDPDAGTLFQHPELVRESSGALDLVYYAGAVAEDPNGTYRWSRAADPATGFAPSVVLWSPVAFLKSRTGFDWLGDYSGAYALNGKLYTSYVTNQTGTAHISFSKAP
jgi:hypothetical protein